MHRLNLPLAVVLSVGAVCVSTAPTAGAASKPTVCSSAGLHYTKTAGSADFSVAVQRLRASGVRCSTARVVARDVARRDLAGGKLPKTSHGYTISVVNPCTACSPDTQVLARHGSRRITFTLAGGK